jgi:hypothetical protein
MPWSVEKLPFKNSPYWADKNQYLRQQKHQYLHQQSTSIYTTNDGTLT